MDLAVFEVGTVSYDLLMCFVFIGICVGSLFLILFCFVIFFVTPILNSFEMLRNISSNRGYEEDPF